MLFGSFLRQKDLITDEQLLLALARQQESIPSFLTILLESKLFTTEILVNLVQASVALRKDLLSLIRDRRLLKESELEPMFATQNSRRKPLGLVLVEMGIMDIDAMQASLSEFLRLKKTGELPTYTHQAVSATSHEATAVAEASASTKTIEVPKFDLQSLDDSMVSEYAEVFDSLKKEWLDKNVMDWGKQGLNKESLRELYREMHTLKGTARFLKAYVTEFTLHQLENLLTEITRGSELIKEELRNKLEDLFLKGFDFTWDLRNAILEEHSEAHYFKQDSVQAAFNKVLESVQRLSDEVQNLQNEIDMDSFKDQF